MQSVLPADGHREAELQPRVDRRRLAIAFASGGERAEALAALARLQLAVVRLEPERAEAEPAVEAICEPAAEQEGVS